MARLKAAQRREQLVAVATKLFARFGYSETTTAAIAEAAGVTEPILYRHFKNKQDLFVAITQRMSNQMIEHWEQVTRDVADPAEKVKAIAHAFPRHIEQLEDAYHVMHGALASSRDKQVRSVMRDHYERVSRFFQKILTDGQRSGVFRRDLDVSIASWQLIYMGIGYAMVILNLPDAPNYAVETAVETLLGGFRS